jgi:hypothetical protein
LHIRGKASEHGCVSGCAGTRYEWANLTGDYDSLDDYAAMCARCHRFDTAVRATLGWGGLTGTDESDIIELFSAGTWSMRALGRRFGVSHQSISRVLSGQRWNSRLG